MYGEAGQWFKPFALTIACSVLVSLFVSFSLDPMLSAYWPDPQVEDHGLHRRGAISRVLARFNKWFDRQADRYKSVIAWALDHRLAVTGIAGGTFVLAIVLQGTIGGTGFVPVSDRSEINLIIEAPGGSNLEYTRLRTEAIAELARKHPEVAYTYTSIGGAIPFRAPGVDQALVYVRLVPKAKRSISQDALGAEFRREFAHVSRRDRVGVHEWIRRRREGGAGRDARPGSRGADEARGAGRRVGGEGTGRGGRRAVDARREARARRAAQPSARRLARHHRGRGRAVAAAGVRRSQGG